MKNIFLFFVLSYIVLVSCKTKVPMPVEVVEEERESEIISYVSMFEQAYPGFKLHILQDSIHRNLPKQGLVRDFYYTSECLPIWIKDTLDMPRVRNVISYLNASSDHGLDPERFKVKEIQQLIDSIEAGVFGEQYSRLYSALTRLEYMSVQSLIDYSTGMKYGFTNPRKLLPQEYNIEIQSPDPATNKLLFTAIRENPDSLLRALQPTNATYLNIQKALVYYGQKKDSVFEQIVPKKKSNYKLHEKDNIFPVMARRLMLTGELPYSEKADSLYAVLNPQLLEAVNLFRINNSYPEETEIGKFTIDALNRPMSYYYEKAKANLERYRWKRQTTLPEKYIEVNVAAFNLKAIEQGQEPVLMNVCVGTVKNETPLLESVITYVNLNPTWNVPTSIIQKELYYSIKKDSTYLTKNRMKLLKNGEVVDPSTLDWETLNDPKRFPYQIKQDSGNGNSLGRIKFMFKNPFSVYLHDTPAKRTFTAKNRAVSHGCVRLQKPVELAYFCITGVDSVYFDRIQYTIDRPPLSQEGKSLLKRGQLKKVHDIVNLKEPVPLFIDYFTAYMLPEDGKLYFADDVYGFDRKIIDSMDRKNRN